MSSSRRPSAPDTGGPRSGRETSFGVVEMRDETAPFKVHQ
jgi:hypothetical protein